MKKFLTLLLVAVLAMGVFAFVGCGNKGIAGTYKFDSMTRTYGEETVTQKVGDEIEGMKITSDMITIEVKEDKTFAWTEKMGEESETMNGTWEEKDGAYSFTIGDEPINAKLDGKKLILSQSEEGFSVEYVFVK